MPIQPLIPSQGLTGWKFLQRTLPQQTELFNSSPDIKRNVDYFVDNIGDVETIDDLMSDRRLLSVALGAYGLGDEINKGAFVRKILEEGTSDSSAFAVRLNNPDYLAFAKDFGLNSLDKVSITSVEAKDIAAAYERRAFENEVGNIDNDLRLALNFKRDIENFAGQGLTENAGWFRLLGSIPMRSVLEGAFNLPSEFSALSVDKQKEILADKAFAAYGGKSIDVFTDPENVDNLIDQYLLKAQINSGPDQSTPGFAALSILSASSSGSSLGSEGLFNLLVSNG